MEFLVDIHIGVFNTLVLRNINLDITTTLEVELLALGEFHNKLLHKGRYATARYNLALHLLNAQNALGNTNLHIVLNLHLATKAPVVFLLFAGEEANLGGQNLATAVQHLNFTHTAATLTTTSRRKENLLLCESVQKRVAACNFEALLTLVDINRNLARRGEFCLCHEQQCHEQEQSHEEDYDCNNNCCIHLSYCLLINSTSGNPRKS